MRKTILTLTAEEMYYGLISPRNNVKTTKTKQNNTKTKQFAMCLQEHSIA